MLCYGECNWFLLCKLEGILVASTSPRYVSVIASVCLIIGIILAPLSIAGLWASKNITDSDGFTKLMAPLASNQGLQEDVSEMITRSFSEQLQLEESLDALPGSSWLPDALSPSLIADKADELIHRGISNVIRTGQFATLWESMVHASHAKTIAVLGNKSNTVNLDEAGVLQFQLAEAINQILGPISNLGIPGIESMVNTSLDLRIIQSDALPTVQKNYHLITNYGPWLIYVSAAFILAGLVLQIKNATRALLSLGTLLGLCALAMNTFLVDWARSALFANLRTEVAESVYYQVMGSLISVTTTTAVIAVILGAASWPLTRAIRQRQANAAQFRTAE